MTEPSKTRVDERAPGSTAPPIAERAAVAPLSDEALQRFDRVWHRHARTDWLRVPLVILAIVLGSLMVGLNARRDPQRAVDVYAPGVTLGRPVGGAAWSAFRLHPTRVNPAPLSREFLHRDPTLLVGTVPARKGDGLADAAVAIAIGNVPANDLEPPTPPVAPAARVAISIPTPDAASRVERRLRSLYGRPRTRCFEEGGMRTQLWSGDRHGGALLVTPTRPDPAAYATPFAARLVLGAREWEARYRHATSCPRP